MPQDGTRRSGRIPKQLAITLVGSDIEGRVFSERTKTVLLSRHGAGIVSAYKLSSEQELVIRSEESHKEIEARVVGQIGSEGETYIYGIAFLDTAINFWGLEFPDLSDTEKQASHTLLECSGCHSREMADLSDLASDVMAVNESIMRYCKKCGSSTLWKKPTSDSADERDRLASPSLAVKSKFPSTKAWRPPDLSDWPERPGSAPEQTSEFNSASWRPSVTAPAAAEEAPTSIAPAAPRSAGLGEVKSRAPEGTTGGVATKDRENRRKHVRTRVNFKACVRRAGMADDVVVCEDMSRGGFRFKSSRQYFEKVMIDVAVPYSPGDQAIFVPAQIAYVQELPEQKMFRCGATYLRGK
jgi:PilZ domain